MIHPARQNKIPGTRCRWSDIEHLYIIHHTPVACRRLKDENEKPGTRQHGQDNDLVIVCGCIIHHTRGPDIYPDIGEDATPVACGRRMESQKPGTRRHRTDIKSSCKKRKAIVRTRPSLRCGEHCCLWRSAPSPSSPSPRRCNAVRHRSSFRSVGVCSCTLFPFSLSAEDDRLSTFLREDDFALDGSGGRERRARVWGEGSVAACLSCVSCQV